MCGLCVIGIVIFRAAFSSPPCPKLLNTIYSITLVNCTWQNPRIRKEYSLQKAVSINPYYASYSSHFSLGFLPILSTANEIFMIWRFGAFPYMDDKKNINHTYILNSLDMQLLFKRIWKSNEHQIFSHFHKTPIRCDNMTIDKQKFDLFKRKNH